MPEPIANVWVPYGLRGSPFFQEELTPSADGPHPVDALFVGRAHELRRLVAMVGGDLSSRVVVEGEPGVGKTSFVSRLKAELAAGGVLTHEQPIRVSRHSTVGSVVADVLRVLVRIRAAHVASTPDRGSRTVGKRQASRRLPKGSVPEDAFWLDLGRRLEGQSTLGVGIGLAGLSMQQQPGRIPAEVPSHAMFDELRSAVERLSSSGKQPVLLHLNNLEDLRASDLPAAARLIKELRDCFLIPGAHWIFVGASGIDDAIFQRYSQVESIFPEKVMLGALDATELRELLRRRYVHLQRGVRLVPPVDLDDAVALYEGYHGDLRKFLRLLSDAAQQILGLEGVKPMTRVAIIRAMASRYAMMLRRRIGDADLTHLRAIITASADGAFRVADVARVTNMQQSSASELVQRLLARRVIRAARTAGRSVYYQPVGDAAIALT